MKNFHYEFILEDLVVRDKKSPLNVAPHFHSLMEIAYCFSGKQIVTIGDGTYELNSGDAMLIFPYTMHGYLPASESSHIKTLSTAILCSTRTLSKYFPAILKSIPTSPVIRAENISNDTALAFFKVFESSNEIEKLGWTYIILANLLEQVELSERKDLDSTDLLVSVIEYVNNNFSEKLSIGSIAKKFAYSQPYIAHLFCDQLKIPFKSYLNSVRCEYAANLLVTTKKSITDIAHESGYNSINSFCRCFKNHFKQSPSQYRSDSTKQ